MIVCMFPRNTLIVGNEVHLSEVFSNGTCFITNRSRAPAPLVLLYSTRCHSLCFAGSLKCTKAPSTCSTTQKHEKFGLPLKPSKRISSLVSCLGGKQPHFPERHQSVSCILSAGRALNLNVHGAPDSNFRLVSLGKSNDGQGRRQGLMQTRSLGRGPCCPVYQAFTTCCV